MHKKEVCRELVIFLISILCLIIYFPNKALADSNDYTGHNSWNQLTTANGISAGIYSQSKRKMTNFQHHIFSHEKEGSTTPNFMYDAYFGYKANNGEANWLYNVPVDKSEYINGTNIIHSIQKKDNLTFDSYYFTPFSGKQDGSTSVLYMILKVTNTGENNNLSIFSQENMHLGTDYNKKDEKSAYVVNGDYLKEYNSQNQSLVMYKNLNSQNQFYQVGNGSNTPNEYLKKNKNLNNQAQKTGNDLVAGFENGKTTLNSGESKWYGVAIGLREDANEKLLADNVNANVKVAREESPEVLLTQEENWWKNWHSNEKIPMNLTPQEQATYRQSTAVLKMSQVKEKNEGYGQVLASLIPGKWSMAWDGSYSIQALIDSGHFQEARDALNFFLNANMKKDADGNNYYQKQFIENSDTSAPHYGLNTKLSSNYFLSVYRYFGDGTEESDANNQGPNIELDGWGLVLWTVDYYTKKTGDYSFLLNDPTVLSAQQWIKRKQDIATAAKSNVDKAKQEVSVRKITYQTEKKKQKAIITKQKDVMKTSKNWIKRKEKIVKLAKKAVKDAKSKKDKEKARKYLKQKQAELDKEKQKQLPVIDQAQNKIDNAKAVVTKVKLELKQAKQNLKKAKTWLQDKKIELTKEKNKQEPVIKAGIKKTNWYKLTTRDADLLLELVDKKTGLILPDSSAWEEHWIPFNVVKTYASRQQFAFTDITSWVGIHSTAEMAKRMGMIDSYDRYSKTADSLKKAIMDKLVINQNGQPMIASSFERVGDNQHQNDGNTVEAINTGLVAPDSELANGIINSFNSSLRITTGNTPGYKRNQDNGVYNAREWGFIDLRIAGAMALMGQKKEAKILINWMTSQAEHNYYLIPELLDYQTQDYAGSVPMGGFGSGSYILAINDYY